MDPIYKPLTPQEKQRLEDKGKINHLTQDTWNTNISTSQDGPIPMNLYVTITNLT